MMIRKVISLVLLLALSVPGILQAHHAFVDHVEVHCQEDIPNHFHSREYQCSFDNFFHLPFDLKTAISLSDPIFDFFEHTNFTSEQVFISNRILHKFLRAPPQGPPAIL